MCVVLLVVAAGCGTSQPAATTESSRGPGDAPGPRLLVTRDFGDQVLLDVTSELQAETSVMALLVEHSKVETGYGGGFVGAIDGLQSTFGSAVPGQAADWFYWVDGRLADIGADYYTLSSNETVWWDYHAWSGTTMIPATLSAFPRPFNNELLSWAAPYVASQLTSWASATGINLGSEILVEELPQGQAVVAIDLSSTEIPQWLNAILERGYRMGVFVQRNPDGTLNALTEEGEAGRLLAAAALCLAHPDNPDALLLVLLGADIEALESLLAELHALSTRGRVAVGISEDKLVPLPDKSTASPTEGNN